jgi:hypothetical protein
MNKKRPSKNTKHLQYVRSLPCTICKAGYYSHHRIVQAHHLLKPWLGVRGMSLKAEDANVIPLCLFHHQLLHTKYGSEKLFFENYGMKGDFGKVYAKSLWEGTQMHDIDNNDLPF